MWNCGSFIRRDTRVETLLTCVGYVSKRLQERTRRKLTRSRLWLHPPPGDMIYRIDNRIWCSNNRGFAERRIRAPDLRFFRHDAARILPIVQLLSTVRVVRLRRDSAGGLDGFWVAGSESERISKLLPASFRDFFRGRRFTFHEWRPTLRYFAGSSRQVVPAVRRLSLTVVA